jgi:hypothetical protein
LCWPIAVRGGVCLPSGSVLDRCGVTLCAAAFRLACSSSSFFFLALFFFGFLTFFRFFSFFRVFSPLFVGACIFLRAFFSFLFFPLTLGLAVEVGFSLHFLPFWGSGREGVLEMVGKVSPFPQPT